MRTPDSLSHSDSELVRRAADGDDDAAGQLWQRHSVRLKQMVRLRMDPRLSARVDASDVVQEAIVTATQRMPEYLETQPIPFYPWLRRITWDTLMHLHERHIKAEKRSVRREQRRSRFVSNESTMHLIHLIAGTRSTPSGAVAREERDRRVRQVLENELSDTDREVLLQRYVEQMSVKEIAGYLGTSEAAVYKRHARALAKVHVILQKDAN